MSKVLIIEDDPLVSRMYEKVMKFEGLNVILAQDGSDGINKAQTEKPDLIFCDIMMPKVNGIEVLERLKGDESTSNIPVVMLTNLSGTQDAEKAKEKGALEYMVKSQYRPKEVAQYALKLLSKAEKKSDAEAS